MTTLIVDPPCLQIDSRGRFASCHAAAQRIIDRAVVGTDRVEFPIDDKGRRVDLGLTPSETYGSCRAKAACGKRVVPTEVT
jgi:hypothetical protein